MMDETEIQLQKLVDGELSRDDERELLLSLDDDSRSWRTLSLLFLEERLLRTSLRAIVPMPETAPMVSPPVAARPVPSSRVRALLVGSLVAACSFCLGLLVSHGSLPAVGVDPAPIAQHDSSSTLPVVEKPVMTSSDDTSTDIDGVPTEYISMKLVGNDNVALQQVEVPVISTSPESITNMNVSYQPMVPDEVRQAFLRQGKTVSEQIQLIPIQLQDGREAVLPITDIRVRPLRHDEVF